MQIVSTKTQLSHFRNSNYFERHYTSYSLIQVLFCRLQCTVRISFLSGYDAHHLGNPIGCQNFDSESRPHCSTFVCHLIINIHQSQLFKYFCSSNLTIFFLMPIFILETKVAKEEKCSNVTWKECTLQGAFRDESIYGRRGFIAWTSFDVFCRNLQNAAANLLSSLFALEPSESWTVSIQQNWNIRLTSSKILRSGLNHLCEILKTEKDMQWRLTSEEKGLETLWDSVIHTSTTLSKNLRESQDIAVDGSYETTSKSKCELCREALDLCTTSAPA